MSFSLNVKDDLINTLKRKKYKLGVVSSKKTDLVCHGLELFGLLDKMDVVIGSDDVKNHKPAPDGILLAIEKTNAHNACYVGDNVNDILAGKSANVKTVGCLYVNHPEKIIEANPDYTINRLSDMLRVCVE